MTYTLRRLRGRQPLCGTGVTSRMRLILNPAAFSARSADSRPEPGPLTYTVTLRTPCSIAFFAASSAASCAANGVDLREPLKPHVPALDQATTLPETSVIETIVLLNVALMCATPVWMFFRTFFFCLALLGAVVDMVVLAPYFFVTAPSFFTAMRRGPLRVRALV